MSSFSVFVGNIAPNVAEEDLVDLFSQVGRVRALEPLSIALLLLPPPPLHHLPLAPLALLAVPHPALGRRRRRLVLLLLLLARKADPRGLLLLLLAPTNKGLCKRWNWR